MRRETACGIVLWADLYYGEAWPTQYLAQLNKYSSMTQQRLNHMLLHVHQQEYTNGLLEILKEYMSMKEFFTQHS